MNKKLHVPDLLRMYRRGERIAALTAYDVTFSRLVDASGVHLILVGDSLGTVIQGHQTTVPVTLDEMVYHTRIVARGVRRALLVADLPFMTYQASISDALRAAGRLFKEAGAEAIKLEGGVAVRQTIRALVDAGIPVLGHVGLTPQSYHSMGGHKIQGRSEREAAKVKEDALAVEAGGAFGIVLEGIPRELAADITASVGIPTIGIGAGEACSGQVLVMHDLLGLTEFPEGKMPKFIKVYAQLGKITQEAVERYVKEVVEGSFPEEKHSYPSAPTLLAKQK